MQPSETTSILVDYTEAAALLGGISRTTLWRMQKSGHLIAVPIGGRSFITRESIESYVRSHSQGG